MSLLTLSKRILGREETDKKASKKKAPAKKQEAKSSEEGTPVSLLAGTIDLQVIVTEQSIRQQENNLVVFRVLPHATKQQISRAVQEKFGVKPLSVKTATFKPKPRRRGLTVGQTKKWKKAYVKVEDISKIVTGP